LKNLTLDTQISFTPKKFLLKYRKLDEFPTFQQEHNDEYDILKPLLFTVAE